MSATTFVPSDIDETRLREGIEQFARLSTPGRGVTRLAYSELERAAHSEFARDMTAIGLRVRTDAAGNTIAELAPTVTSIDSIGAVGTGSHLDSVPEGGRFDGIVGVVAAMEVARAAVETDFPRRRPWRFVAFAAEEGARFGQACTGSRIVAGLTKQAEFNTLVDADGITLAEAMENLGFAPAELAAAQWDPADWHSFVELHIEQGSVLEATSTEVGVVDVISGSTRLRVTVSGRSTHTGGTPMHLRHDALVTAARCVIVCDEIARDAHHHGTRITVGTMEILPNSLTTIPGEAEFSIDIRDVDSERQRRTADAVTTEIQRIAADAGTRATISVLSDTSPVILPTWVAQHAVAAAHANDLTYRVLPSGASHDSQQINRCVPAGLIFVPSRGGISHAPEEDTGYDQIAQGTRVLLTTMMSLDADCER